MRVLCVAEKPSMARQISSILAPNGFDTKNGKNKYCKNFEFAYMLNGERVEVTMTSVMGHIAGMDFGPHCKNWSGFPVERLFNEQIIETVSEDMRDVAENLRIQARRAQRLIIWTDCDREGEYIGFEIEKICLEANARLDVYRARYSVVSPREIHRAMNDPDRLDRNQIAAVATRQEIDLRTGASLTRLQSMALQNKFAQLKSVVSYGSCQFPTLGFVVEQYLKLFNFVPTQFWTLKLTLEHEGIKVPFFWDRNRIFDRQVCAILYSAATENVNAKIRNVASKPTSKWKPLPLRTVEFQKKATKALRLSSDKLMALAEKLYNQGYISYPRTETDQYDSKFDHKALIGMQVNSLSWGQFASNLLNAGKYGQPRLGKNNDKAHPPIHPTKAGEGLTGDEARVYEFIVRSYLAACSQDAKGQKTTVKATVGYEGFHAQGIAVTERNYLEVYPYEFWNDKAMAQFQQNQVLRPSELLMDTGKTSPPSLLTESDLIGTMDKNGIGTDATIHEHIKKIIDRKYVLKTRDSRFCPTLLGLSLVQGYDEFGLEFSLTKPRIRAMLENDLNGICNGREAKDNVIRRSIEMFRRAFNQASENMETLFQVLNQNLRNHEDPFASAPLPNFEDDNRPNRPNGGEPHHPRGNNNSDDDDDDDYDHRPAPKRTNKTNNTKSNTRTYQPDDNEEGPNCACNKPSNKKKTIKPGPNQGRFFWTCGECNFFAWADEPIQSSVSRPAPFAARRVLNEEVDENPPFCSCNKAAAIRTVNKDGPNKGRQFYCCSASASESSKCSYFLWKDTDTTVAPEEAILRCFCGLIAVKDTAKTGTNAGKSFNRCSKQVKRCTFFQWDGVVGSASTGPGDPSMSRCFKCGEEGHYSSSCPLNKGGGGSGGGGSSSRGRGSFRGRGRGRKNS